MRNEAKIEMRKRARMVKGLVNLLNNDAEYIYADANDFDLLALSVSVEEIKDTIQKIIDNVTELEYIAYLYKRDESC